MQSLFRRGTSNTTVKTLLLGGGGGLVGSQVGVGGGVVMIPILRSMLGIEQKIASATTLVGESALSIFPEKALQRIAQKNLHACFRFFFFARHILLLICCGGKPNSGDRYQCCFRGDLLQKRKGCLFREKMRNSTNLLSGRLSVCCGHCNVIHLICRCNIVSNREKKLPFFQQLEHDLHTKQTITS